MISTSVLSISHSSAVTLPCLSYGVYISQIIWYARALHELYLQECAPYAETAPSELWGGKNTLSKFYGHHHELIELYDVSVSKLANDIFTESYIVVLHW